MAVICAQVSARPQGPIIRGIEDGIALATADIIEGAVGGGGGFGGYGGYGGYNQGYGGYNQGYYGNGYGNGYYDY